MGAAGGEPRDDGALVTLSEGPADIPTRVLVVGLGSPDRGDDGVGPKVAGLVARAVMERHLVGVHVVEHEDPTALVDLLDPDGPAGAWDEVIVVDAVRSGAAPGSVTVLEVGADGKGFAALGARLDPGPAGTHGFGLAGTIELARALDRLPRRVVVVGIEALGFGHGAPLSDRVAAAIDTAVDAVMALLPAEAPARGARAFSDCHPGPTP